MINSRAKIIIEKPANALTCCRFIASILLLFVPVFSLNFYILYLFCGFSDVLDGTIARKTNSASSFGSKLDTAADFLFMIISLIRILPAINIPTFIWIWIAVIFVIKLSNVLHGLVNDKMLISEHTIMNKITGFLIFSFPFTIPFIEITYSSVFICVVATLSAIDERNIIRMKRHV